MSDGTAVAEPITRTPNSPIELLELKNEITVKKEKARKRAIRANHQLEILERREAAVDQKLAAFSASGGGDLKAAALKHVQELEAKMAAVRAQFGL